MKIIALRWSDTPRAIGCPSCGEDSFMDANGSIRHASRIWRRMGCVVAASRMPQLGNSDDKITPAVAGSPPYNSQRPARRRVRAEAFGKTRGGFPHYGAKPPVVQ